MFDAGHEESVLLKELSLLEVALLFIRAGYSEILVHPGEVGASAGDILVRDGASGAHVVVMAWDCERIPEQHFTFDMQPKQVRSGADQVRGLIRHAYQAKASLVKDELPVLVVVRPFLCGDDASLAFDDATVGDGVLSCVETDVDAGEVVCRIRRTGGAGKPSEGSPSGNVFADLGIDTGLSAACLYRPPYESPQDAFFRLKQNADAVRHPPAEMFGRLAAAAQVAVLEGDDTDRP
jgi:hypothetical protein